MQAMQIYDYLFFHRHHAQVFRVKTVQSVFPITVKINIIATALPATVEDIAKQVRSGSFSVKILRNIESTLQTENLNSQTFTAVIHLYLKSS